MTSATKRAIPCSAARCCELLEQTRADTARLEVVGDGEGNLGHVALTQACVTGQGDDALTIVGGHCADQRPTFCPIRLEVGRDEARIDRGMAVEA